MSPRSMTTDRRSAILIHCLDSLISITLVAIGGLFAGLTLTFMGQDQIQLQVIAESGSRTDCDNARKVLDVLQRGRHWVLVSLLLGNVITNEALPIVLDREVKGGWLAVLASTILIVIFGEIIPQSLCAKHGLKIGAWSSRYVLCIMYVLYPVAYPVSQVLDHFLGVSHGMFFDRTGLKTFITLHARFNFSSQTLHKEEVTIISSILDLHSLPVSTIMTPFSKLYTVSANHVLDEMTRSIILSSGFDHVPVYMEHHPSIFVGILPVKSLASVNFGDDKAVAEMRLDSMLVVRPDASVQDMIPIFRDRKAELVLVVEKKFHGKLLGIVTARDILSIIIGM